ncbi:hypothetical protein WT08_14325 [Burkholderia sp. MSMB1552]|nr:hypothetical protein WT08_14325 [Burkholderia sp. MSMB1552]KWZ55142.1 hypothetical protein WS92_03875 [Burkholderia sp. MSMB1588]
MQRHALAPARSDGHADSAPTAFAPEPPPTSSITRCRARSSLVGHASACDALRLSIARMKRMPSETDALTSTSAGRRARPSAAPISSSVRGPSPSRSNRPSRCAISIAG